MPEFHSVMLAFELDAIQTTFDCNLTNISQHHIRDVPVNLKPAFWVLPTPLYFQAS